MLSAIFCGQNDFIRTASWLASAKLPPPSPSVPTKSVSQNWQIASARCCSLPLQRLQPENHFALLDSNGKKTRFLFQARTQLKLTNTIEINARAEEYSPKLKFDAVLTRAFSDLPTMLQNCHHLIKQNGLFLAMKGKWPQRELDQMPDGYRLLSTDKLCIPGVEGERHLIKIKGMEIEDS